MKKITTVTTVLYFDLINRGKGYNICHTTAFNARKAAELHARDSKACFENALAAARERFDDDEVTNPEIGEIIIQTVDLW